MRICTNVCLTQPCYKPCSPLPPVQHLDPSFYLKQHHRLAGGSRERSLAGGAVPLGALLWQSCSCLPAICSAGRVPC